MVAIFSEWLALVSNSHHPHPPSDTASHTQPATQPATHGQLHTASYTASYTATHLPTHPTHSPAQPPPHTCIPPHRPRSRLPTNGSRRRRRLTAASLCRCGSARPKANGAPERPSEAFLVSKASRGATNSWQPTRPFYSPRIPLFSIKQFISVFF